MAHQRAYTNDQDASRELLVEVSRMYYERYLTQAEIARAVGVSRSQVSRYLKAAHDEGIVQITIVGTSRPDDDLEQLFRERFPLLTDVVIVPSGGNGASTLARVASAGAELLTRLVHSGDTVSVGAGRTLAQLVASLGSTKIDDVVVVQAMGNAGHEGHDIDYNAIATGVASSFGGRAFQVNAPAILSKPYLAEELEKSQASIGRAIDRARHADVYVLGLGTLASDMLFVSTGLLTEAEIEEVGGLDPAGDICGRFYDLKGKPLRTPFDDRIVGIELSDLRKARSAIGVATGADKARPLLGALRGRFLNHVVTDEATAREVLALAGRRPGPRSH